MDQRATPMQGLVSFATALLIVYLAATLGDYKSIPDWIGYERLYLYDGGWLLDSGRDPIFTSLLSLSLRVFGSNGYENFRSFLVLYFIIVIGYICWICPRQKYLLSSASAVLVGLIAAAVFAMKALVQIREGLGFSMLMFAVLLTIRSNWRFLPLAVFPLSLAAVLTHSGLAIPALAVVGSWFISWFINTENRIDYRLYKIVLATCIIVGFVIALLMIRNPDIARQYFEGYVSERTDVNAAGYGKYAYWLTLCFCCYIIHKESLSVDAGALPKLGVACIFFLSSIILPTCASISVGLVFLGFPDGTVLASFGRLLFTVMSLVSLTIIFFRSARPALFMVSIFILADQVRIMIDNN